MQETPIIEIKIKGIEFVSENKMTNIDADTEFTCVITRATSSHWHTQHTAPHIGWFYTKKKGLEKNNYSH